MQTRAIKRITPFLLHCDSIYLILIQKSFSLSRPYPVPCWLILFSCTCEPARPHRRASCVLLVRARARVQGLAALCQESLSVNDPTVRGAASALDYKDESEKDAPSRFETFRARVKSAPQFRSRLVLYTRADKKFEPPHYRSGGWKRLCASFSRRKQKTARVH